MRGLWRGACTVAALLVIAGVAGCIVEKSSDESAAEKVEAPKVDIEGDQAELNAPDKGAFERLGARMDRGAEKLDKELEKGTEKLGAAMQRAGREMEERSQEAQQRRLEQEAAEGAAPTDTNGVDIHLHIEKPQP